MHLILLTISFLYLVTTKYYIVKTGNVTGGDATAKIQKEFEEQIVGEQGHTKIKDVPCKDMGMMSKYCPEWTRMGYCEKYPDFMLVKCRKSCKACKGNCNCGRGMPHPEFEEISGGTYAPPTAFPWIVRLVDGCPGGLCAGTLVSPKVVLSAYHCTVTMGGPSKQSCDHSDGKRLAVLGSHVFKYQHLNTYEKIPVIQVLAPPHAPLDPLIHRGIQDYRSHDFALLVLQYPAKFHNKVSPICLPEPYAEFGGQRAIAAGWGRFAKPSVNVYQSPFLRMVELSVSPKRYRHTKMFGTVLTKKEDEYQDPCSGDSGGPLMYLDSSSGRYVLIGTVQGGGYDCRHDTIAKFEGSDNGVWNKVSAHMEWIQQTMGRLGQRVCKAVTG